MGCLCGPGLAGAHMVELVMMRCDRLNMTVSTAGCGRLFQAAQPRGHRKNGFGTTKPRGPDPWDARAPCQFCPVGARHAGMIVAPMAKAVSEISMICPRCTRPASRLIEGHWCVSCYNRHREADAGRNRRGTRPALADVLHTESLAVAEGATVAIRVLSRVASRAEAMLALAKAATGSISFGVAPLVLSQVGA